MTLDDLGGERGLSLRPLLPWLLMAAAFSVAMMVLGTGRGDRTLSALAAGLFVAVCIGTSLGLNAPLWAKVNAPTANAQRTALRCNVWLAALVYAWGASALFAMYSLSDLWWQHAFQYASGASLFAAILGFIGLRLGRKIDVPVPAIWLTVLHGSAAFSGLVYLIGTGKLATTKNDWAANEVFLWGGIAIVVLCIMSWLTQRKGAPAPATPAT